MKWKLREIEARMKTMVEAKLEDPNTCECGKLKDSNTLVRGLKIDQQDWHVTVSVRWKLPRLSEWKSVGTTLEDWQKFRLICQGVMVSMKQTLVPYYCLMNFKNQREL